MIEIYLLEQLLAVRECGTLSDAAEKLNIAQPSVSRAMKKLEGELVLALFSPLRTEPATPDENRTPTFWVR
ncbi:MAG: LysR family transcriptional regulator [Clostridia bacterium]|nr:LysR family transcriptional regulator [Clostridia bacterium]